MEQKKIKLSEVMDALDKGITRGEMAEHFGISKADVTRLFKHPSLKGLKARKAPGFVFEDDSNSQTQSQTHTDAHTEEVQAVEEVKNNWNN